MVGCMALSDQRQPNGQWEAVMVGGCVREKTSALGFKGLPLRCFNAYTIDPRDTASKGEEIIKN